MNEERKGSWVETASGKEVYPLDPRPEEIDINDIAHALSLICRYNGHTKHHYSVAQHSVLCAEYAYRFGYNKAIQTNLLLHDAAEAYICDIPRPIKHELTNYTEIEEHLQSAILKTLGITPMDNWMKAIVKDVDDIMLNMEAPVLLPVAKWAQDVSTMGLVIEEWTPREAEELFLQRFNWLMDSAERAVMEIEQ